MNLNGFDATQIEDTYSALPSGEYHVVISKTEDKETKNKDGMMLVLTYTVNDGEHKNRLLMDRFNLVNKSQAAVEMAKRQLATLCKVINVLRPRSSNDFIGKMLTVDVVVDDAGYNRIRRYREFNLLSDQQAATETEEKKSDLETCPF